MKLASNTIFLLMASWIVQQASVGGVELKPTFQREHASKNIAFFAPFGGSSHISWVRSIGNELGMRGHNFTFLTVDHYTRLGKSSPHVKTISVGKGIDVSDTSKFTRYMKRTTKDFIKFTKFGIGYMYTDFERDFIAAKEHFENNDNDLAICDHYADPCYSAASLLRIPYVVTSAFPITEDSAATYINHQLTRMTDLTTEFQSFTTCFGNKFFAPLMELYYLLPTFNAIADRKRAIDIPVKIEDPSETWKHSLRLFIGPIIPATYPPLTEDLKAYLDAHERVAYIAFGQMATPVENDVQLILIGLLESMEQGRLDGLVWATVHTASFFPDTITTSSNTTYHIQDMFNHRNPRARVIQWAP